MGHANIGRELVGSCGLALPALGSKVLDELSSSMRRAYLKTSPPLFMVILLESHPPSLKEVEEACHAAPMHEFVRDLLQGYDTLIGGGAGTGLSGGRLQRLSIARA